MRQILDQLSVRTYGPGLTGITDQVRAVVGHSGIKTGLVTVFCRHTSASLLIQENADADVQRDLLAFFRRLVPEGDPLFVHTLEGADDMPAHVKSALTQTSLSIPVDGGEMVLGIWQGLYLFEHRARPHTREIALHVLGD